MIDTLLPLFDDWSSYVRSYLKDLLKNKAKIEDQIHVQSILFVNPA